MELDSEILHGLQALIRTLDQAPPDETPKLRRRRRVQLVHRRGCVVEDHVHRIHRGVGLEGSTPCDRLVENAAEREDVGTGIDGPPLHLLGRHVARGSEHDSLAGPMLRPCGGGAQILLRCASLRELREAEIQDLRVAVFGDHEVARLQIPVNDSRRVGVSEPFGSLGEVAEQRAKVFFFRMHLVREGLPIDPFHRDEVDGSRCSIPDVRAVTGTDLISSDLIDRDDVRVIEGRGGFRFENEPAKPFLVPHQHGRKDFQRDATLEGQILGEVNFPHSPGPECPYHPVVRDLGARLQHSTHQSCPEGVP